MKREVRTCDVCDRELPLRGVRGQTTHKVVRVKSWWHWPLNEPKPWEPDDICEDCWDAMVKAARQLREESDHAVA